VVVKNQKELNEAARHIESTQLDTRKKHTITMASYLPQLLKMKSDLDALIASIRTAEGAATPAPGGSNSTPDAPKKRGRPSLSKEEKAAAKKAAKKAAAAIAAGGDSGSETKPKKTLSPEHLAKLKAGREAAKARKSAEAAAKTAAEAAGGSGAEAAGGSDSDSDSGADSD
jgi:hypothetical protein